MKWIDVLIILIYTLWFIISWKFFEQIIEGKADKGKIIFYAFTANLLLAMAMALLHL